MIITKGFCNNRGYHDYDWYEDNIVSCRDCGFMMEINDLLQLFDEENREKICRRLGYMDINEALKILNKKEETKKAAKVLVEYVFETIKKEINK